MQFSLIVVGMSIILWNTLRNNREIKSLVMKMPTMNPTTILCRQEEMAKLKNKYLVHKVQIP